jgi:uncharacterized protein
MDSTSAEVLRTARRRSGATQAELARRAGVTQSVISAYERGRREPSLSTLSRLVEATGQRLDVRVGPPAESASRRSIRQHRARIIELAANRGASNVRLFGSTARGDDRPDSDIDLLVDIGPGVGLLSIIGLERELAALLGRPVDVVPAASLKPGLAAAIADDVIPL